MAAINSAPVRRVKELLRGSPVHVGAAIGFPLGQTRIDVKLLETRLAIEDGADEIDYVVNLTELKAGNLEFREAAAQTRQIVEGYGLPEVAYFLDTFMDSFSLTLDQLKSPGDPQESCGERKA